MRIMKRIGTLVLLAVLFLVSVAAGQPDVGETTMPAPLELTAEDDGTTHAMVVGQEIVITMQGSPGTGYSWYDETQSAVVELQNGEGPEGKGIPAKPDQPVRMGGGAKYRAVFKAIKPGEGAITLEYKRIWETNKAPAETVVINILVRSRDTEVGTMP